MNKVTSEQIKSIMDNAEWATNVIWGRCTIVTCKLQNGFILTESSACVDETNYDHEIGVEACMKRIEDKVWMLEGYRLASKLEEEKNRNV